MQPFRCLLFLLGLLGVWSQPCGGQAQPKFVNATFQSLLSRVAARDKRCNAILKVKPLGDAAPGPSTLDFSIDKLPDTSEVLITVAVNAKPDEPTAIYEQYRLRIDEAIAQELKNCAGLVAYQEKHGYIVLKLRHLSQDTMLCVPTCAAMALDFYGDREDPHYLKSLSTPPNNTFAGTYFRDMVVGVARLGHSWQAKSYTVNDDGFQQGLGDILASLKAHHPVLVDLHLHVNQALKTGHTVLIVGCDQNARQLFYLDPALPSPGTGVFRYDDFQALWYSVDADVRAAILTRP